MAGVPRVCIPMLALLSLAAACTAAIAVRRANAAGTGPLEGIPDQIAAGKTVSPAAAGAMTRVTVPLIVADAHGAKCLDGTPPVFLWRQGVGIDASKFIVFLEGGGWCFSPDDCAGRAVSTRCYPPALCDCRFSRPSLVEEDAL